MCVEEKDTYRNLNAVEPHPSYSNGNGENGPRASEITTLTSEIPKEAEPPADGWIAKLKKKSVPAYALVIIGIAGVVIGFSGGILYWSQPKCMPPCSQGWTYNDGKCYYFSNAEDNWDSSKKNCSSYDASLTTIDSPQERKFLFHGMKWEGPSDHWIGLRREGENDPWKWTNGSVFNNWFKIGSSGNCVYLNDEAASSTTCNRIRHWICRKPAYTT